MNRNSLSLTECNILRGIAIIGIILHNYSHSLHHIVDGNEHIFLQDRVDGLNESLLHFSMKTPVDIISFLGHYGVPVFLFLSAYGLEKKYGENIRKYKIEHTGYNNIVKFIKEHYLKLFFMMILGYIPFMIVDTLMGQPHPYTVATVSSQLLLLNNLYPDWIHPGPFWYFGLTFQFYVLYRLILVRQSGYWLIVSMTFFTLLQLFLSPEGDSMHFYRSNFMGSMLPFGLGLLYSRYEGKYSWIFDNRYLNIFASIASLILIYLCSQTFYSWIFAPFFVCSFFIYFVKSIMMESPNVFNNTLAWVGTISSLIFITHPIVRRILIEPTNSNYDDSLFVYLIVCIWVAVAFKPLVKYLRPSKK